MASRFSVKAEKGPKIAEVTPETVQDLPRHSPQHGPRRAQGGAKWALHGPKMATISL